MTTKRLFPNGIRRTDDTGSLALALLLILVGVALRALLVPMVLTQLGSTRQEVRRDHALAAAQAGIDIALGHIRASVDGTGAGDLTGLPCTDPPNSPPTPLSGNVGTGTAGYQVTVSYYDVDPLLYPGATAIPCVANYGTAKTPAFALVSAKGTEGTTGRTLQATYTFRTTNQNIAGGLIHIYKTANLDLCMDAGSASPAGGVGVQMQPCSPGSSAQTFAYNKNLTISLAATTTPTALGMCLDAGASPESTGLTIRFQTCGTTTKPQQQWSFNDQGNIEGTNDGQSLNKLCLNVQSAGSPGSLVVLGTSGGPGVCRSGKDTMETWEPEAGVGAGAAGPDSGQLVNFNQFGRCLDVTSQKVDATYLIDWPCKQAPNAANVKWNQRFTVQADGSITTNSPSGLYCLVSPESTDPGKYPVIKPCKNPLDDNMKWTVFARTDSYETSFRILDDKKLCLAAADPILQPNDVYPVSSQLISRIVMQACSGSTLQKWNADPDIGHSLPLKDIAEK
ncbi:MAG: hypothetical protein AUI14_17140 [Actinobacteria bacterium 13_2_20CM_2_71_6]|nr:MAG: hypothetical protein AUI14_17140 [Actinobacteria bacterium 13_2_20CM_2_71_6]